MVEVLKKKVLFVVIINILLLYSNSSKIKSSSQSNTQQNKQNEENLIEDYKILTATSTIFIAGLGDRSFIITTLMATKYNKFIILLSAFTSLGLMSFFSVFLGENLPYYISNKGINYIAIFLFVFLGLKMISEGLNLPNELPNVRNDTNRIIRGMFIQFNFFRRKRWY